MDPTLAETPATVVDREAIKAHLAGIAGEHFHPLQRLRARLILNNPAALKRYAERVDSLAVEHREATGTPAGGWLAWLQAMLPQLLAIISAIAKLFGG